MTARAKADVQDIRVGLELMSASGRKQPSVNIHGTGGNQSLHAEALGNFRLDRGQRRGENRGQEVRHSGGA